MTVCHHVWEDVVLHVCGKRQHHDSWHQCACGAALDLPLLDRKRARRDGVVPTPQARTFDDGEGLRYTAHAAKRRAEMNVRHHEVRRAVHHPDATYPVRDGRTGHQAGRIVAVVDDGLVVTLLWHRAEGRDDQGQPVHCTVEAKPKRTP